MQCNKDYYSFAYDLSLSDVVDIENEQSLSQNSEVDKLADILDTSLEVLEKQLMDNDHDSFIFS